jgi:hypothetical protein
MAAGNLSNRSRHARGALAVCCALLGVFATLIPSAATGAGAVYAGPSPRAHCGPGSHPETAAQGRVPQADYDSGRVKQGYSCNLTEIGRFDSSGGFKVFRYVDAAGHQCAFFDSTLVLPIDILQQAQPKNLAGVYVLDMSDPRHPRKTTNLVTPAMLSPHESLMLARKRGLLIADMGSPLTYPGFVDIYDVRRDCRSPTLLSSTPLGILGHESGISPDEKTFWVTSTVGRTITALDISNPATPIPLWVGTSWLPHGVRVSPDGKRLYVSDVVNGLHILDVGDIQRRVAQPQVRELAHLEWPEISIPQVAIPITVHGHPYLVEVDEFGASFADFSKRDVGAARIIDIADERHPRVISNLRLEVNMPAALNGPERNDPRAFNSFTGYSAHYCAVPRTNDPGIVGCSFILSGLRMFDIRDPFHPRELAYFNKPVRGRFPGDVAVSMNLSAPEFIPERGEIWYIDANSGFWALRFTNGVWPFRRR